MILHTRTLSESEVSLAKSVGKARNDYAIKNNLRNTRRTGRSGDVEIHTEGAGAEIYTKVLHGLDPSIPVEYDLSRTDFVTESGKSVDVKSTNISYGNLIIPIKKHPKTQQIKPLVCDCYALVIGELPTYSWAGYATREMVENAEQKDPGFGLCWWVNQYDLITGLCK